MASRTACPAVSRSGATVTPLPAASPSALTTTGKPNRAPDTAASAASGLSHTWKRAVGTPWLAMNALANALLDSSCAAVRLGPNSDRPRAANRSWTPRASGNSGPTTVRSTASAAASARIASGSETSTGRFSACWLVPALPGAQTTAVTPGSRPSFHTSACSRAPLPTTSILMPYRPLAAEAGDSTTPVPHRVDQPAAPAPPTMIIDGPRTFSLEFLFASEAGQSRNARGEPDAASTGPVHGLVA